MTEPTYSDEELDSIFDASSGRPLTLDEFIALTHSDVDRFKAMYLAGHAKNPDHYPLELGDGDWYEQFNDFMTSGPPVDTTTAKLDGTDEGFT